MTNCGMQLHLDHNPRPMRRILLLASPFLAAAALAQQITNVTVSPSPLHECEVATFNVIGTAPSGMQITFINSSTGTNSLTLVLQASGPSSGSSPFNDPVGPFGPFTEGDYALTISLEYNGNITSTWNGNFTVLAADLPDVGDFTSISVCSNAAPFQLISRLDGSPDPGGIWLDPMLNVVASGTFTPGTSLVGDYQYYFPLPAPCIPDYQSLEISYLPNGFAGENASVTICTVAGLDPVDLFTQIGGTPDAGGTWTGPNTTGIFTPGESAPGAYVYHVAGIAPCEGTSATVTVIGGPPSDAGVGDSANYCFDEAAADLFNHIIGGAHTGVWYGPDWSPIGFYSQVVDVATYGAGNYAYIVETAPCPSDTTYAHVTLDGPPCTLGLPAEEAAIAGMRAMPNPSSGTVTVEITREHPVAGQSIEVLDVNGRTLSRTALDAMGTVVRQTLDISPLAPGAYILRMSGGGGATTLPLLVQ